MISAAVFASRVLGLVREVIQTNFFGISAEFAAFQSARLIPNILRELLAEGAFSTAFITIFAGLLVKKSKEESMIFVNKSLIISFLLSIIVSAALFFTAPILIPVIHKTDETMTLTVQLFRIMLPFITIMSVSSILMGFLNSHNKFGIPAWAPFMSNIAFITSLILLRKHLGIYSLPLSLIIGGAAQLLFQVPSFFKSGFCFKPVNLKLDDDLKRFFKLFLPFAMTMGIPMLYTVVTNPIATGLSEYGNVVLSRSFYLVRFVISIVAFSIGTVSLPNLSKHFASQEHESFTGIIRQAFRIIIIIAIPIVAGAMLLSNRASSFVWQDITFGVLGELDGEKLNEIGYALFLYSPGILFSCMNTIIHRAFQSMKMWKTPLIVGLITVAIHYFLSAFLSQYLSYHGIALSFSIVSFINFLSLFSILQNKISVKIKLKDLLPKTAKTIISASAMIIPLYLLNRFYGTIELFGDIYINKIITFILYVILGSIVYFFFMTIIFKDKSIKNIFKNILGENKS